MPITATLQIAVAPAAAASPFDLVRDSRDEATEIPSAHLPATLPPGFGSSPPGRYSFAVTRVRYGKAIVRLYCPASPAPTLTALNAVNGGAEGLTFGYGAGILTFASSGYAGQSVVNGGRRDSVETELVQFNGAREASIKYAHDVRGLVVTEASEFLSAAGETLPTPAYVGGGLFRARAEAFGGLVVQYTTSYSEIRLFYDPLAAVVVEALGNGRYMVPAQVLTPVYLFARAGDRTAFLQVERLETDYDTHVRNDTAGASETLKQVSEVSQALNVYDPTDDSQYIQIQRPIEGTFIDDQGNYHRLIFKV